MAVATMFNDAESLDAASATDTTTTTITNPAFPFTGFFSPVDNPPTENSMNAATAQTRSQR
jgi:hypothetical protein